MPLTDDPTRTCEAVNNDGVWSRDEPSCGSKSTCMHLVWGWQGELVVSYSCTHERHSYSLLMFHFQLRFGTLVYICVRQC